MSNASSMRTTQSTIMPKYLTLITVESLSPNPINKLSVWSKESTLAFNNDKSKVMILSTPQMSRVHHLDEYDPNIAVSGYKLERIKSLQTAWSSHQ